MVNCMGIPVEKLYIFISGPSDTQREKDLIKSVIESLSKVFCPRLDIVLEATMGDTHAMAGVGRPQSKINPWVSKCDLFIGIFKNKYGTYTGKYNSGSKEEFNIAFKRNLVTKGIPEILLFFKKRCNKNISKNIEAELKRIFKFKEDIRKKIYFETYSSDRILIFYCYEQIIQWIYKIKKPIAEMKNVLEDE